MSRENLILNEELIKETFNEDVKLKIEIPESERCLNEDQFITGDLFESIDGKLVKVCYHFTDFTPTELAKFSEYAEELYAEYGKEVTIYIICHKNINVCVKECEIYSEADFSIKLIMVDADPAVFTYGKIRWKFDNGIPLDSNDLFLLKRLPVICERKNRKFFREEYFRIMNKIL